MRVSVVCVAIVVLCAALAVQAATEDRTVLYHRKMSPSQWRMTGFAAPTAPFTFRVLLKQRNLDVLDKLFWDISTPDSPAYREFMTTEQVMDIIEAPLSERRTVQRFLASYNMTNIEDRRDVLIVRTTVAAASVLFNTRFYVFTHEEKANTRIIRQMGEYSLPTEILPLIDFCTGVTDFPMIGKGIKKSAPAPNVDGYVVPQTYNAMYNAPAGATASGTSQGVAEFQAGENFDPSDLATFSTQTNIPITPLDPKHIINPIDPVGIEGTLDIQYIAATGVSSTNWYWTESDWLYEFGNDIFNATDAPNIFSISYDWSESAQCDVTSECSVLGVNSQQYVERVNTEFQKVGTKGISLMSASGDSGANGRTDPSCTDPVLHPDFPACSPYVTSVGATQLINEQFNLNNKPPVCNTYQCASSGDEQAVSYDIASFTSGGGFSNYVARPSYQDEAVLTYLNSTAVKFPPATMWQKSNRGFPDIAALGHNVLIYQATEGGWVAVGGTSCASPAVAGYMSQLNAIVIKKTGKPLGFLNPFLYKMYSDQPSTFRDITVGDNVCTEGGCSSSCKGFYATTGWDPVTGLGVPNVSNMITYVNKMFGDN